MQEAINDTWLRSIATHPNEVRQQKTNHIESTRNGLLAVTGAGSHTEISVWLIKG